MLDVITITIAAGAFVATAGGAAFAFVQAREAIAARRDAQTARDEARAASNEAAELARVATAAFVRQAEAQEEANRLKKASIPEKVPEFTYGLAGKDRRMFTNTGEATAYAAQITKLSGYVMIDDAEPRDVGIGDSLFFNVLHAGGEDPRVNLSWQHRPTDGEHKRYSNDLTLP